MANVSRLYVELARCAGLQTSYLFRVLDWVFRWTLW